MVLGAPDKLDRYLQDLILNIDFQEKEASIRLYLLFKISFKKSCLSILKGYRQSDRQGKRNLDRS